MSLGQIRRGARSARRRALAAQLLWRTSGAATTSGLTVSAKTLGASSVRVRLSTTSDLATAPVYSSPATPGEYGESKHVFTGLAAGTQYYYAVEPDGVIDPIVGKCSTIGGAANSFRIAAAGCALTDSSDPVFAAIAADNPRLFMHLGDAQYRDLVTTDPATWAAAYDGWLGNSEQNKLWRACAIDYIGSDHDTGPNNNDAATARGFTRWADFYRRYMPHHPLPAADNLGTYHTYLIDPDVRVIATDTRAYKTDRNATDNATKTMLGSVQKQWFKDTLLAATEPVIIWQQELPWNTLGPEAGSDSWRGYNTERTELANFITSNNLSGRMMMVFSDMHAVGWVSRAESNYGGFPLALVGPLDQTSPSVLSAMTIGPFPSPADTSGTRYHQYGLFDFVKTATDVTVSFTAKNAAGTVLIPAQTVTYSRTITPPPNPTPTPAAFPSDLTGLTARYRGQELGADGSTVASWPSAVSGGTAATQPTAARQPVVGAGPNSTKAVAFSSDVLLLPAEVRASTSGVSGITAFVVAMASSVGSGSRDTLFLSSGASATSSRLAMQLRNTGNLYGLAVRRLDTDAVATVPATGAPTAGQWFAHTAVIDYAAGAYTSLVDGTVVATGTGTAGTSSATASVSAAIGAQSDTAAEPWVGSIAEVIIFNRALTAAETARVHAYIRDAYGITVNVA